MRNAVSLPQFGQKEGYPSRRLLPRLLSCSRRKPTLSPAISVGVRSSLG